MFEPKIESVKTRVAERDSKKQSYSWNKKRWKDETHFVSENKNILAG